MDVALVGLSKSKAMGARLNETEIGGTPIYAAPEQLEGMAPQPSMDIYAMDELLHHMVTGAPPFVGTTTEICTHKLTGEASPASSKVENLDENLERLIMKSLQRQPNARQTSMAQLVFELRTVMDMFGVGTKRRGHKADSTSYPRVPTVNFPDPGAACERCPVPIFFADGRGTLTGANNACARFLKEATEALVGQTLGNTRMGNVYPGIDDDLCATARAGTPVQRLVTFRGEKRRETTLLVWLVPQKPTTGGLPQIWGMIVPLEPGLL